MKRLLLTLLLGLAPLIANAQSTGTDLAAIILQDCGAGERAERFESLVAADPQRARSLFREVLSDGPDADLLATARRQAAMMFDRQTRWATANQDKAHARAFLAGPGRDEYLAETVRRIDLTARTNALRGLGLVGTNEDEPAIRTAIETDKGLERAGRVALDRISKR